MPSGKNTKPKRVNLFTIIGIGCFALSLSLLLAVFWPVILKELGYNAKQLAPQRMKEVAPIDREFGIVIPKIGANAKVIPDVDPYNSRAYQVALTKGVAHAQGTGIPGKPGNIFLFSHSSVNFYEASRYNSVFYLLTKLETTDKIDLYYKEEKYTYAVTSKQIVPATAIQYLKSMEAGRQTLTLMTCWPPGTTYKRLLVIAERVK